MNKNLTVICVTAFFAISISNPSIAQQSRVGLKGGLAMYSTTASISIQDISEEETTDSRIGFAAGLFVEKPFSDLISIQLEGLYVQKGGKDEASQADVGVDVEDGDLILSYVDVPVLLKINIPVGEGFSPFIYGGGFAGYLLDATAEADGQDVEDEQDFAIEDLATDLNYGVIFGAGLTFGSFTLDIRYDMGLANIFDKESDLIQDLANELGGVDQQLLNELLDGIEITTSGLMVTAGISF